MGNAGCPTAMQFASNSVKTPRRGKCSCRMLDRKNVQLLRVSCDHEIQLKPLTRLNWRSLAFLALPDPGASCGACKLLEAAQKGLTRGKLRHDSSQGFYQAILLPFYHELQQLADMIDAVLPIKNSSTADFKKIRRWSSGEIFMVIRQLLIPLFAIAQARVPEALFINDASRFT